MAFEFPNGALVSSFHGDGSGELLAAFQYEPYAKSFCEAQMKSMDNDGPSLVVTCLYSGKSTFFMNKSEASS